MNKLAGMTLTSSSPQLSVAQPEEVSISELLDASSDSGHTGRYMKKLYTACGLLTVPYK